jgi:hypothetical protein
MAQDFEQKAAETPRPPVSVVSPAYCSDVKGDTAVTVDAPGFKSLLVKSWKHGNGFGTHSTVATVAIDAQGKGSFVFPPIPTLMAPSRDNQRRGRN